MTQKTGNSRGLDEMATGPLPVKPTWGVIYGKPAVSGFAENGFGEERKKISGGKRPLPEKSFSGKAIENRHLGKSTEKSLENMKKVIDGACTRIYN